MKKTKKQLRDERKLIKFIKEHEQSKQVNSKPTNSGK
jgi:hypothetical protein